MLVKRDFPMQPASGQPCFLLRFPSAQLGVLLGKGKVRMLSGRTVHRLECNCSQRLLQEHREGLLFILHPLLLLGPAEAENRMLPTDPLIEAFLCLSDLGPAACKEMVCGQLGSNETTGNHGAFCLQPCTAFSFLVASCSLNAALNWVTEAQCYACRRPGSILESWKGVERRTTAVTSEPVYKALCQGEKKSWDKLKWKTTSNVMQHNQVLERKIRHIAVVFPKPEKHS